MGVAHYVVVDSELDGVDPSVMDGRALAGQAEPLAKLARSCGVQDLWSFHSENPDDVMAFLESEGADLEPAEMSAPPAENWFEPKAGLRTARALRAAVEADPSIVGDAEEVLADLKQLGRILEAAESQGAKWHLAVDF